MLRLLLSRLEVLQQIAAVEETHDALVSARNKLMSSWNHLKMERMQIEPRREVVVSNWKAVASWGMSAGHGENIQVVLDKILID